MFENAAALHGQPLFANQNRHVVAPRPHRAGLTNCAWTKVSATRVVDARHSAIGDVVASQVTVRHVTKPMNGVLETTQSLKIKLPFGAMA